MTFITLRYIRFPISICLTPYCGKTRVCRSFSNSQDFPKLNICNEDVKKYIKKLIFQTNAPESKIKFLIPELTIAYDQTKRIQKEICDLENFKKCEEQDKEMMDMINKELEMYQKKLVVLDKQIFDMLTPSNEEDNSNAIIEVSAGVGGQEAMLFAVELFQMYMSFANFKKWTISSYDMDKNDLGGIRSGSVVISGKNVYGSLKYEGGVHRVQRIPKTEKSGRIHTSTVAIAILPQPTDIALELNQNDLKIETKRASGSGGQHVNTTDSAVRIVHIPTGLVVENQTGRSQIQNKKLAIERLRALLYQKKLEEQNKIQKKNRKLQIGMSGRSEKIRTYNYAQSRVTDHRIGLTIHDLTGVLEGKQRFQELINQLGNFAKQEQLQFVIKNV